MKRKSIPFLPLPLKKALKVSRPFYWISDKLAKFYPYLEVYLVQSGLNLKGREYFALAIFSSFFWFFLMLSLMSSLLAVAHVRNLGVMFGFPLFFSFLSFFYVLLYPKLLVVRKIRNIEKNLLFAVRHLYIQVKSGVSLFDALVSISKGNYGLLSKEFEECTKKIAAGGDQIKALEELAFKNPSLHFRRIIWQIVNSLKSGADIGNTLSLLANHLSEEQKIKIRKYGSQLSPMALMYLMLTIIIPTLGITFLIIFSTFSGIQIPEIIFYAILGGLALFQFMFIGII
ncbi:MAG TPA: hypothetical protein ENF38_00985, partial [Candidatus Aenigmarchaeota archaeon]|nr:hypothetical protein [Candidatus Aenigmarchaeota archaeon]